VTQRLIALATVATAAVGLVAGYSTSATAAQSAALSAQIALANSVSANSKAGGSVTANSVASTPVKASSSAASAPAFPPSALPEPEPTGPISATKTSVARNVPDYPLDGGKGRRIVYDKALMTVWIVDDADKVVRRYPVVGRWDRPLAGKYRIYSKSENSSNSFSKVNFRNMVRFAWGQASDAAIGFHTIPVFYADTEFGRAGQRMHGLDQLGLPIARGGCVRQSDKDADFLYAWSKIGDRVVVLPSP